MKKKIVSLLLCAVMTVGVLAGCGNKEGGKVEKGSEENPVEISYACWDSGQAELLRQVADDFEAENKDIKIDIQVSGWDDYWTGLEAAATGGSLPDTFWMYRVLQEHSEVDIQFFCQDRMSVLVHMPLCHSSLGKVQQNYV